MNDDTTQSRRFMVSIYEPADVNCVIVFTFVPAGSSQQNGRGTVPQRVPQFVVGVRQEAAGIDFDWSNSPDDPGAAKSEIERDIRERMTDRAEWTNRVNSLVELFEQWATELNWSTRRIEKKLDDTRIGKHRVPGLLLQEDACRILLEPVGRSAPGAEGVVDLYLMPAYDDIATLYFYDGRWNLHYLLSGATHVGAVREAPAIPLTKESLEKVLAEMKQNAA